MFISFDKAFFEQINNVNHAGYCCFMKISKRKTKHLIKSHKENLHICVHTHTRITVNAFQISDLDDNGTRKTAEFHIAYGNKRQNKCVNYELDIRKTTIKKKETITRRKLFNVLFF
jgi:hypothetical protein